MINEANPTTSNVPEVIRFIFDQSRVVQVLPGHTDWVQDRMEAEQLFDRLKAVMDKLIPQEFLDVMHTVKHSKKQLDILIELSAKKGEEK